jgi:hypothetical protein
MVDWAVANSTTANMTSSLGSVTSWTPLIGIIVLCAISLFLLGIAYDYRWFKRINMILRKFSIFSDNFYDALKGGSMIVAGYVIYWSASSVGGAVGEANINWTEVIGWLILAIVVYFALAYIGKAGTYIYRKIQANYERSKEKKTRRHRHSTAT